MAAQLLEHGLHAQWSAPQPTVRPKPAPGRRRPQVTPWSVKQGGAAVAARQEIPLNADNARDALRRELWETQRWAAAALPFGDGKQYLRVRSAYAKAGASTDDRLLEHSEIYLQKILKKVASLGDQPVVLSVDANLSRERSATLNALFTSSRWIDVAYEVAGDRDQLQATYHKDGVLPGSGQSGATRIDFLVCNRCAWAYFKSFRHRFDLKIPCHLVTELVLTTQPFSPMCTVWLPPLEYHPNKEGFAQLETDGCDFVEFLVQRLSDTLRRKVEARDLNSNVWVAPKSSELSRYSHEDNQDAVVLLSLSNNESLLLDDALSLLMVPLPMY